MQPSTVAMIYRPRLNTCHLLNACQIVLFKKEVKSHTQNMEHNNITNHTTHDDNYQLLTIE